MCINRMKMEQELIAIEVAIFRNFFASGLKTGNNGAI